MQENREKMKINTEKLSDYLFDKIGKYISKNSVSNNEMIATLMMMLLSLIGSIRTTKLIKLQMVEEHFKAIKYAIEMTEDNTKQ